MKCAVVPPFLDVDGNLAPPFIVKQELAAEWWLRMDELHTHALLSMFTETDVGVHIHSLDKASVDRLQWFEFVYHPIFSGTKVVYQVEGARELDIRARVQDEIDVGGAIAAAKLFFFVMRQRAWGRKGQAAAGSAAATGWMEAVRMVWMDTVMASHHPKPSCRDS